MTCMRLSPLVNPNSYDRLKVVLQHLAKVAKIKGFVDDTEPNSREWVTVVCDGLPYGLIAKIIAKDPEEYGWLLLRPGGGHYEMNMVKSFFELVWPIFMMDLAKLMGFSSNRALDYCRKAQDHHKSWQLLEIFMEGTSDELLLPYICAQLLSKWTGTLHRGVLLFGRESPESELQTGHCHYASSSWNDAQQCKCYLGRTTQVLTNLVC